MIVDDNVQFIELMKGLFSDEFHIETACNGFEGLGKAITFSPELIMLDVNMPGITGIEFARRLSSRSETAGIPIIVITASDYNSLTQSLLQNEHNVKIFMTKLSPLETIREKVMSVIKKG